MNDPVTVFEPPVTIIEAAPSAGPETMIEVPHLAETVFETSPSPATTTPALAFRDWRIVREFSARGGESDIYLVERGTERLLLKLYRLGIEPSEEVQRQIARLSAQHSDHLVSIRDFGLDEGTRRWFELQEFIENGTLRDLLTGRPDEKTAAEAVQEISNGLGVLHANQILHLDLKPANILVRSCEPLQLVFTDFGISSILDPVLTRKITSVNGTPHYWAPESITGVVGPEADWWALGMVTLEILLGSHPFAGIDNKVIMFTLATKGVEIPATIPPRFVPLVQGLLTREPHLRWGAKQVERWLSGETGIPVHYRREEKAPVAGTIPYRFCGKDFAAMRPLVRHAAADTVAWHELGEHLEREQLEKWLTEQGDTESALIVRRLRKSSSGSTELAVVRLISSFDETLPFTLYGKVITFDNLRLYSRRCIEGSQNETEGAIVDDLMKGNLLRMYREYLLLARKETGILCAVLETIARMSFLSEYNYSFGDDLLTAAEFMAAVAEPDKYLLPREWIERLGEEVVMNASHMRCLVSRERFSLLAGEQYLPKELADAITREGTSSQKYLSLLKLLHDGRQKKLFIGKEELQEFERRFVLPFGISGAIRGEKFKTAMKAAEVLRLLEKEGFLLEKDGLEKYLSENAASFPYVATAAGLVHGGGGNGVPLQDYRKVAVHRKREIPLFLVPKLNQVFSMLENGAEEEPRVRQTDLYRYLAGLKGMQIKWDTLDRSAIREIFEQLVTRRVPVPEVAGLRIQPPKGQAVLLLERIIRREFQQETRDTEWALKGMCFGIVAGIATWFAASRGEDGPTTAAFIGIGMLAAANRTVWAPAVGIISMFALWGIGEGAFVSFCMHVTAGALGLGTVGATLGSTRPRKGTRSDSIRKLYGARIEDVARTYEEERSGA